MKNRILALCLALSLPLVGEPVPYASMEFASIDILQEHVTAFSTMVGNPMMGLGFVGLGNLLGTPGFLGLDKTKPVRLLLLSKGDILGNQPIIILPLSTPDGADYLASIGTHFKKESSENRFATYTSQNGADKFRFRFIDGHAIFANPSLTSDDTLEEIAEALQKNPEAYSIQGIPGALRIQIAPQVLLPFVQKLIRESLEAIDEENAELRQSARKVTDELTLRIKDIARVIVTFDAAMPYGLSIGYRIDAIPGSSLEKNFSECSIPSAHLLSLLGGSPEVATTDGILLKLMFSQTALMGAFADVLTVLAGDDEDLKENVQRMAIIKSVVQYFPKATATVLRYDAEGRPYFYSVQEGITEEGFQKIMEVSAADGKPYQTRTAQGATLYVLPVDLDISHQSPIVDYINQYDYCSESLFRDGTLYSTFGPAGTLDSLLGELLPANTLPCEPLKTTFADLGTLDTMGTRISFDVGTVARKVGLYFNRITDDDADKIPEVTLDALAQNPGRIGSVTLVSNNSFSTLIRITPGFFQAIRPISTVLQKFQVEPEEEHTDEDLLEEASDEELDALLKEADKLP